MVILLTELLPLDRVADSANLDRIIKSIFNDAITARPIYRSANIYRLITRLADISYRPFSTDKLLAINKNVLFTILLINARFFGAFACAVAQTFKHENYALERACTHTQMTSRTFKLSEYMHINVRKKNIPNNCLRPLT